MDSQWYAHHCKASVIKRVTAINKNQKVRHVTTEVEELQLPVLDVTASFIGLDGSQDSDELLVGWLGFDSQ
jgi:hypothetical protein